MGYSLQIDSVPMQPLASIGGWKDAKAWIAALPPDYKALHHFALYGWEDELPRMTQNLTDGLKNYPPKSADLESTIKNWLLLMKRYGQGATVATITDGQAQDGAKDTGEEDE